MNGYGWVRLLPMVAAVGGIALLHIPESEPSAWDWVLAVASAAVVPFGGRYPLSVLVVQSGLLLGATMAASIGAAWVIQILASVALAEVALRRPGAPTWWGTGVLALVGAANYIETYTIAANALIVALNVGLPLLLGSFLRAQRDLAQSAHQRAAVVERNRVWETTAARATERAAVARELHDVVAHHVASIVLRVGVVRHVVPSSDPRVDEALRDVHAIGGQALTDLRRLVSVLRDPDSVDEPGLLTTVGLRSALDTVLERTRQAGVDVEADLDEAALDGLGTAQRHAVLRVVQEGLTNVLKHAGPHARARLALRGRDDDGLEIELRDDGGGRTPRGQRAPDGHGLFVMRERMELLSGSLRVGREGRGWALHATLPGAATVEADR